MLLKLDRERPIHIHRQRQTTISYRWGRILQQRASHQAINPPNKFKSQTKKWWRSLRAQASTSLPCHRAKSIKWLLTSSSKKIWGRIKTSWRRRASRSSLRQCGWRRRGRSWPRGIRKSGWSMLPRYIIVATRSWCRLRSWSRLRLESRRTGRGHKAASTTQAWAERWRDRVLNGETDITATTGSRTNWIFHWHRINSLSRWCQKRPPIRQRKAQNQEASWTK